jgi:hypothetical protein
VTEAEERPYICVHARKGTHKCSATSSYEAAKKAAAAWGLKSTAGIDAYLADVTHVATEEVDDRDELTKKLFPRMSPDEMKKRDQERNRKMNQQRFMKPGKPSRSREWGAYEGVNENASDTYARISYDYSDNWASIVIFKDGEQIDSWNDYFHSNETGNPLVAKFVEMAEKNGIDPTGLPIVDEEGNQGVFDGRSFKWNSAATEEATISEAETKFNDNRDGELKTVAQDMFKSALAAAKKKVKK